MDETPFEILETINAEIDIWIDEEEYEEVRKLFFKDTMPDLLTSAFPDDGTCTAKLEEEWIELLGSDKLPIKSINYQGFQKFSENNQIETNWSRFFWAKLIRAKIQEKGTTCYFRRTDDVISYLERNLPIILKEDIEKIKKQKLELTVIYFLEMSACGTDADIRSFADRARRFIQTHWKEEKHKYFNKFYDLLARYNIGISHFHEANYRKAALEFNMIIDNLNLNNKNVKKAKDHKWLDYLEKRQFKKFILIPSILMRANLQLKLQLAYHAQNTIYKFRDRFGPPDFNGKYGRKEADRDIILAEAYWQMGKQDYLSKKLNTIMKYLLKITHNKEFSIDDDNWLDHLKILVENKKNKCKNLTGQLLHRKIDEKLQIFKGCSKEYEQIKGIFNIYKEFVVNDSFERSGYLQQISKFLKLLIEYGKGSEAQVVYSDNKEAIIEAEYDISSFDLETYNTIDFHPKSFKCPCKKNGIDLRRLGSEHYDEFYKNMLKYYENENDDFNIFNKRLLVLEKEARENLIHRKRGIIIELNEKPYSKYKDNFCKTCINKKEIKSSFERLLHCLNNSGDNQNSANDSRLSDRDYERIMYNWDKHFLEHLKYYSCHDDSIYPQETQCTLHFIGLQRWNSSSPAKGSSLGGGYLMYYADEKGCVKLGIAIDPGFDYIKNLFHEGFSLSDIDIVLLSHAHLDHSRDFESMVILLLELKKRTNSVKKHKLHAIMTLGIYSQLKHIITSPGLREFIDPYIIDITKEIEKDFLEKTQFVFHNNVCQNNKKNSITSRFVVNTEHRNINDHPLTVTINPTRAYHNDYSQYSDSYGYTIQIEDRHNNFEYNFGYSGDTSWDHDVIKDYYDCDALLLHLGSLIDRKSKNNKSFHYDFSNYNNLDECFDLVKKKNHPYFVGMLHFLKKITRWKKENKTLVLMSEFGEELRGKIRLDFVSRINDALQKNGLHVLPVDVGLDVLLKKWKDDEKGPWVKCVFCNNYIPITREKVDFETYGLDEGLFCVCTTCKKSVSTDVKIDKLRQLYEVGHEFRKSNEEV